MQHALSLAILLGCAVVAAAAPDFALPSNEIDEPGLKDSDERPGSDFFGSHHARRRPIFPITGHDAEFGGSNPETSFRFGGLGGPGFESPGAPGGGASGPAGGQAPRLFIPPVSNGSGHLSGHGGDTGTISGLGSGAHSSKPTGEPLNYVNSNNGLPGIAGPSIASSGGIGGGPFDEDPTNPAPAPATALLAGAGIACVFLPRALRTARASLATR